MDNEHSLLDATDLVFIDPVETGWSRPAPGVETREFTGFTRDVESVGDFIRLWVSRNGRWASPKFIAGESYGITRAAGLARYLQDRHGAPPGRPAAARGAPPDRLPPLRAAYFEAGHMMYVREESLAKFREEYLRLIRDALAPRPAAAPARSGG